eukprot:TRINITY_DN20864_c0_g1_i1.p1 TRINITY_DN20864_c0_g1~~TRINITY_DN20864_c0_g1_i1.p1  ORF type:complete len:528 (+),score=80.70 TRINITY_DN20864_c0_g1_i1:43-1626(+)
MTDATTKGGEKLYGSTLEGNEREIIDSIYNFTEKVVAENADKAALEEDFKKIVQTVNGASKNVKVLAAQTLPKYAANFPDQISDASTVMLALCDDADDQVAAHALRGLPNMCKDKDSAFSTKVAGLFLQVMCKCNEKPARLEIATRAMDKLIRTDVESVLTHIFTILEDDDESNEPARVAALNVLTTKISPQAKELLHPNESIEEMIKTRIEKILEVANETEFSELLSLLTKLKIFSRGGKLGVQGLANILGDQCGVSQGSPEEPDRLLAVCSEAVPFLKSGAKDEKITTAIATRVLPGFSSFSEEVQQKALVQLCEVAPHCSEEAAASCVESVWNLLVQNLADKASTAGEGEKEEDISIADCTFSFIEALLFIVQALGSKAPKAVGTTSGLTVTGQEGNADSAKAFKDKLLFTHDACTKISAKLSGVIQKARQDRSTDGQSRLADVQSGLICLKNITGLARSLMASPASFSAVPPAAGFSWSKASSGPKGKGGQKSGQKRGGGGGRPAKRPKPSATAYAPPARKGK